MSEKEFKVRSEYNNEAINTENSEIKNMPRGRYVRVRSHYRRIGRKRRLVRRHIRRV